MNRYDRIWKYIFVIACVVTQALVVVPGRFISYDEVFFKSAGRHWAATGQFAAPEIVGRIDVTPGLDVVYFAQPPIYTFAYGVYTKAVGFGPHRCILFDSLIHILLAVLTVVLARRIFGVPARYAYAVGILVLPLGSFGRPDELAMCLGIAGILSWTIDVTPAKRAMLCGAFFGLCGATSIGVWLFTSPLALLVGYHRGALNIRTFARAIAAGLVVAALCVAPILVHHPDAYRQLLVHASVQSPELGAAVDTGQSRWKSVLQSYVNGTTMALRLHGDAMGIMLGTLVIIALCFRTMPLEGSRMCKLGAIFAAAAMLVIWLILPGKVTYLWFFGPWLLSIAAAMVASCFPLFRFGMRAVMLVLMLLFITVGVANYAKGRLIVLSLPKEQSFDVNMAQVRALIPAGSHVVTGDYWWALADKCQVFDPQFSHPIPIDDDYFVKSGNGSGRPGKPESFVSYYEAYARDNHFITIEDNLNRSPLKIGGIRLTNSGYGFGPLVLGKEPVR